MLHRHARRASLALAVVVALIVSGCRVGPDYKRPEMPPPAQYRGVAGAADGRSRWPTCRGGRSSTTRPCRR